jgi:predicted HicB family RNase H-like nuclease
MKYKNYYARIEYDEEDNILVGHVAGINSIIGFHAEDLKTLEAAFHEAVDAYLDHCAKAGKAPQKTYSGQMMLRVKPSVHAKAALAAERSGKSLNQWSEEVLSRAAQDAAA